nr:MAG TPA: hypothetical protein [Bacteriophage sp.]
MYQKSTLVFPLRCFIANIINLSYINIYTKVEICKKFC